MFKKIGVRNELLRRFKFSLGHANPYKLDDVANYIYYDSVNEYLPIIKKHKLDNQAAAIYIIKHGLDNTVFSELSQPLQEAYNRLMLCYIEEEWRIRDIMDNEYKDEVF